MQRDRAVAPWRFPCPSAPCTLGQETFIPEHDSMHGTHAQAEARATGYRPTPATKRTLWPVASSAVIGPDDFVEPLDDLQDFLRCSMGKALPKAFNSQRPNLTDFHPRPPGKFWRTELEGQREASTLGLTG